MQKQSHATLTVFKSQIGAILLEPKLVWNSTLLLNETPRIQAAGWWRNAQFINLLCSSAAHNASLKPFDQHVHEQHTGDAWIEQQCA